MAYTQSVGIVFFDNSGRILALSEADRDDLTIPGGVIDEGETIKQALYREIKEEIGLDKKDISNDVNLLVIDNLSGKKGTHTAIIFGSLINDSVISKVEEYIKSRDDRQKEETKEIIAKQFVSTNSIMIKDSFRFGLNERLISALKAKQSNKVFIMQNRKYCKECLGTLNIKSNFFNHVIKENVVDLSRENKVQLPVIELISRKEKLYAYNI